MNWGKKTKNFITIAMLYAACATPSLIGRDTENLENEEAYQQGIYDAQHNKPCRSYLLSRKKKACQKGRDDARNEKSGDKNRALAIKFKAHRQYYEKRSSGYELYDHGPMYGNPNIPGR